MTTIHFSQIDLGVRGRTKYDGIAALAESIEHNGLVQPIVLSYNGKSTTQEVGSGNPDDPNNVDRYDHDEEKFPLLAGGRRYHALQLLLAEGKWDGILTHASTSKPGAPGYLLKGEAGSELTNLLTELAENLDRQDMDWRDEVPMLVKAARLVRQDALTNGHEIVMRDLGSILGVGYHDYRCAEAIAEDLKENPQDYEACSNVRVAYTILLKKTQQHLESVLVKNTLIRNAVQNEPSKGGDVKCPIHVLGDQAQNPGCNGGVDVQSVVPLTSKFHLGDGIAWLATCPGAFDHVICDPDFAVAAERLEAGATGAGEGIAQASVEESLGDLFRLMPVAFAALKTHGFFIFFYDLDHHEKLQHVAKTVGFAVQRWPFVWHKTDYNSNAAPAHNQTKDLEYAMICRKPGTTLAKYPCKSVLSAPSSGAAKTLGHPFSKPASVWTYLFTHFCLKGQTVADPFAGAGSSVLAAIDYGLDPHSCELQEQHYNSLILNLQAKYRSKLGPATVFS